MQAALSPGALHQNAAELAGGALVEGAGLAPRSAFLRHFGGPIDPSLCLCLSRFQAFQCIF